jgi:hypothetical protein
VTRQQYFLDRHTEKTKTIEYQCCQPHIEKLLNQQEEIIIFSLVLLTKVSQFMEYLLDNTSDRQCTYKGDNEAP